MKVKETVTKKANDSMTKEGLSRVDGRLKVTGKAKYSAEYNVKGLVYGVMVGATITKGSIKSIDTKKSGKRAGGAFGAYLL